MHHGGRFSFYDVFWCARRDPAGQRMPGQGMANSMQLPGEACSSFPPPPTPEGPAPRHPHKDAGWGESREAAAAVEEQRDSEWTPKKRQKTGGWRWRKGLSSPLRPCLPEHRRHAPSPAGGMLRKGKGEGEGGKRSRAAQSEAENDWERERVEEEEEEGSGRLTDVTSALSQSLTAWSHGRRALMP